MGSRSLTAALRETLDAFDEPGTPLTTAEMADRLDLGRRSTFDRLERLVDAGRVETKKVGARGRVWWRPTTRGGDASGPVLSRLIDNVPGMVYRCRNAPGWPVSFASEAAATVTGYDPASLQSGEVSWGDDVVHPDDRERVREAVDAQLADGDQFSLEYRIRTADGETRWVRSRGRAVAGPGGRPDVLEAVVRDVTERRRRERGLRASERRNRTLVDRFPDGVVALFEPDLRHALVVGELFDVIDLSIDDVEGKTVREIFPTPVADDVEPHFRAVFDGETREFEIGAGGRVRAFRVSPVRGDDGRIVAGLGVSRYVTDVMSRERELEARIRQQDAVTELGRHALEARDPDELMAEAAAYVAETLDNDCCGVFELDADADELRLRQGVGWPDGAVGSASVPAVDAGSQAAATLGSKHPVVVDDLASEPRFEGLALLADDDVRNGVSAFIGHPDDPWGMLGTHDRAPKGFSEHDVAFVQSVANVLKTAIDRHDYERELVRQRERLAVLDDLNRVVRDLTGAVVDQSTREEIETVVCEGLAATDSYEFAWIGGVDARAGTMRLRTEAGVDGYLDERTIPVDGDDPASDGPIRRAVQSHEIQVVEDIFEDESHERWRETAREWGYQSAAVIPIRHDDVLHGVLCVYADRTHAFSDGEYEVIGHLGEVVGHAVSAVERERALTSSEVVELEFQIAGVADAFDLPSADGRMTTDRSAPVGDGAYLVYGTATEGMIEDLDSFVEAFPHWESVRPLERSPAEGLTRFEARLVDPPILSSVTALGGYVDGSRIEHGDYYLRVHLAPSVDARRLLDIVQENYPMARLVSRQQIVRDADSPTRLSGVLADHLTERQRAALEAAYFAGYFEWPRDTDGEVVAGALGVSAPTFHQHLRHALRKLLRAALDAETPA